MRHAGKHSWRGRRQRPGERTAWPSRPEAALLLILPLPRGVKCWIWGFPWKNGRVCLICVWIFYFLFPLPLLFWSWVSCQCCESGLAWLPKLASLGQLKAVFNLHSFGKGAQKQHLLCRCLEVALGLMRCHQGGDKAGDIWKNSCARPASSSPGSRICPKSGWEVPGSSSCLQGMEQN